jgi:hypothetical protein
MKDNDSFSVFKFWHFFSTFMVLFILLVYANVFELDIWPLMTLSD